MAEWNEIVSTDESRFCLQHHVGRIRVWRHRGVRMLNSCEMHRHTGPAPGIMVLGGIGYHTRLSLVRIADTLNSQRYISEVLEPVVLPYSKGLPTAIFQQDNARSHVAHIVQRFFVNRQIELLSWPARSPDLSPKENMWSKVAQRLSQITSQNATPDQLWQRVEAAWSAVPQEHIQSLFEPMPRRVAASIVNTIVDSVNTNPRCFFIDWPGGTDKTFYVYSILILCVRAVGKIVIPMASTGIAATLLSGGQTVHSRFKLPIPLLENSVSSISVNSSEAERIRRSSLIIWDEAPMAHYRALEIVDRLLRDIMHCGLAFGGKFVVLGGDFRQVLPVVSRASRAEIVAACIKRSKLWPLFVILRLTLNMRAGIDAQSFSQWFPKVGDGDLPTDQQGLISLPDSCIFQGGDLVQKIFGSLYSDITALSKSRWSKKEQSRCKRRNIRHSDRPTDRDT
ncbi:hypothetical protein LAZ67_21000942 [Cordylochernes scorpioides]|uniref:ATP-dependent DNA helicase n=1 Tax=Cordylochernes scorpioides TaxID=51811 RepID=A0ABY6LM19_9ARAC|nr:hypothetical protein LAZ67_21000942 [Cordylochernes scorpioides]